MTIYVVTSGWYSSYGIMGVFTDKAKAQAYAETYDDGEVEEYEADPENDRVQVYQASIGYHGDLCKEMVWIDKSDLNDTFNRIAYSEVSFEDAEKKLAYSQNPVKAS